MLMTDKKLDLEKRLEELTRDREDLSLNLDNSSDRINMLEKKSREQEYCVSKLFTVCERYPVEDRFFNFIIGITLLQFGL